MDWHILKKEDVLEKLDTTAKGLSEKEAEKRIKKYGKNKIKELYKLKPIKIFFKQFKSFLIYILIFAAIFSFIIKYYIDAAAIFAIVILNAIIGFIQQYKVEKSILKLKQIMRPKTKVFRNKRLIKLESEDIVPGDILFFEQGDRITADCRIINSANLETNEAILTGESLPIEKQIQKIPLKTILAERKNMLYSGTTVVKGSGKAVVVATGMSTEFGKIAQELQKIPQPQTPMQKKLDKFAKQISIIIIFLAMLTFGIGLFEGRPFIDMFLVSVALAVSAIPESLPAVITLSLAFATNRMLRKKVLIRRLPAAESLGSVTIICSDKTGTLTEEKMSVNKIFCNNKLYKKQDANIFLKNKKINLNKEKEIIQLIKTSILCNNARFEERIEQKGYDILGDPTESALVSSALDLGLNKKYLVEEEPRIQEISFTSERKMMSILRKGERREILYSKGAPKTIIEKSSQEFIENTSKKLNEKRKNQLIKISESLEKQGYRVLAFGFKIQKSEKIEEQNLIFLGFMALIDPPRKEVRSAILKCKRAGIKIKIITGDSELTTRAIAREVGVTGKIITGTELEKMGDLELEKKINQIGIFARTTPQQKLRIVNTLKSKNEEVAITGDGINDVLALKKADIGISMGKRGTDVAREVSDMILIDDNFASIIGGVEEGRVVYDNSRKITKFLLASNFDELFLIGYTILRRLPLPILPLQILWINLLTDSLPAFALTKEQGENVLSTKPRREKSLLQGIWGFVIIAVIVALTSELILLNYGLQNLSLEKTRTMMTMSIIGFEIFFSFSCRSDKSLKQIGIFSNMYIVYSFFSIIALQALLFFTPLSYIFRVTMLSSKEWLFVLLASLPGLIVFEILKIFKNHRK